MDKIVCALLLSAICGSTSAEPAPRMTAVTSISRAGGAEIADFQHASVMANGVRLHYVVTGKGEPVVLVPGWPQSWYAWRLVMPELVRAGRRVYALDPRGFGDSDKPPTGYDPDTAAKDLHAFMEALGLSASGGVDVVGHDVGTWIAYFHAATFPQDVRRLVLTEASIPGVSPPPSGIPDRIDEYQDLAIRLQSPRRPTRDPSAGSRAPFPQLALRQ